MIQFDLHGDGYPMILGYPIASTPSDMSPSAIRDAYLEALTPRFRVLVTDFPHKRLSERPFTVEAACSEVLSIADAAGFDRFVWWGYSWGGFMGLLLASHSQRVSRLVCGGWPPINGPRRQMLNALKALPSDATLEALATFYESALGWDERSTLKSLNCPRLLYYGGSDDYAIGGQDLDIAKTIKDHQAELKRFQWDVAEIPGQNHSVCMEPELVLPVVQPFLDAAGR